MSRTCLLSHPWLTAEYVQNRKTLTQCLIGQRVRFLKNYNCVVPRHLIFLLKPWAVSVFWETWAVLSLGTRYILHLCKLQWSPIRVSCVWHHDIGGTQLARLGRGGRLLCSCYHKLGTPCLLAMFKQIASNNRNVSMKPEEKSNYLYKVIPRQACQFTCYKTI